MTDDATETPSLELGRFVTVLKRRWPVVVAGIVLGCLLATAYLLFLPRSATAVTLVNVNVISTEPFKQDRPASDLLDSQTEIQLARSTAVVSLVSKSLGGRVTPQEVRNATQADLLAQGTVLRIAYTATTPAAAEAGANALAKDYLQYRSRIAQSRVDSVVDQLNARRTELTNQLAETRIRLTPTTTGATRARLEAQAQATGAALNSVSAQLTGLQALDTEGGTVLTSADGGTTVVSPRLSIVAASGLLGGVILGVLLAFLVNVVDRRVLDQHDVESAGGGAVLARVRRRGGSVPPVAQEADAIRSLRERLLATLPENGAVVTVAEVSRHGAPTNVVTNLALACAQIGMEVHLVFLEHSPRFLAEVTRVLGLEPVAVQHRLPLMSSTIYPGVSVTLPDPDARPGDNSADQLIELLDLPGSGSENGEPRQEFGFDLTLVALPRESTRSLRLAAGRLGHVFVLVVTEHDARIEQVADVTAELNAVNGVIHGTVLVARGGGRRFGRSRTEGAERPQSKKLKSQQRTDVLGSDAKPRGDARKARAGRL